jgi:type II secretory pathway component PulF
MPVYDYKVTDKYGVIKEGSMSATSEEEVAHSLNSQDLTIIRIKASSGKWTTFNIFKRRRVSTVDMVNLMDNLATMIKSGLTLLDAISVIKDDIQNPELKEVLTNIEYNLESGISFSDALLKYPDIFDGSTISLIKAGELSGQLEEALSNLAFKTKQDFELSRKIKSSMAYPIVIFSILFLMASGISIFILPKLADAFSRMTTQIPFSIRVILSAGNFIKHYWYLVIIGIALIIWLVISFFRSKAGKRIVNKIAMKIPLIKEITLYIDLARYSYSLSMLLKSGVPIAESLHIASSAVYNDDLRRATLKFENQVTAGITMSNALDKTNYNFPSFMKQMVNTGEKTGHLEESFLKIGNFYNEEVNVKLKTMTTIIEPILMLIIGVLVAIFIIAILSPIYQVVGNFKMH